MAHSVIGVPTSVPAFIGYTELAPEGLQAIPIGSLAELEQLFGAGYGPRYSLADVTPAAGDFTAAGRNYRLVDESGLSNGDYSPYNLYGSLQLFYANGGANCYVVSVGRYGDAISSDALIEGLQAVEVLPGPTMLVVPDAVLLDAGSYDDVVQAMIRQCNELQDRVAILDLLSAVHVTQASLPIAIGDFRQRAGNDGLGFAVSYFPALNTSVVPTPITYMNIIDADLPVLRTMLKSQATPGQYALIDSLVPTSDPAAINQKALDAFPLLAQIEKIIAAKNGVLPPSGAMAGVYAQTDAARGVWSTPANVTLSAVVSPAYRITNAEQEGMNLTPDGKAVNAIRELPDRGTVVWGARTLDGNNSDYRYVQVRRTLIYIEQSVKQALEQFVFAANDGNTWSAAVAMVSNFLQGIWAAGGLMAEGRLQCSMRPRLDHDRTGHPRRLHDRAGRVGAHPSRGVHRADVEAGDRG